MTSQTRRLWELTISMISILSFILSLCCILGSCTQPSNQPVKTVDNYSRAPVISQDRVDAREAQQVNSTVYITRTGSKYHRATCRYLKNSKIEISLKSAKLSYAACKVCRP